MSLKLILNADDFGPIDFINEGIYHHVIAGNLDSAQVLVNFDENKLRDRLKRLHSYVPKERVFDLGVHFTLTSGAPITIKEDWGKMLKKGEFKAYQHFNFGYADYLGVIKNEFEAQRDRLQRLVDDVNTELNSEKLVVNSVSNHHNIFTIAPDLFETYIAVAQEHRTPLKVRAPKAQPYETANLYYEHVLPLLNLSDSKEQRQLMADMNDAFSENMYHGNRSIQLESPHYIDIDFYKSLGSMTQLKVKNKKVENRLEKFEEMVERAQSYVPNSAFEPKNKVIEFVFHLGAETPGTMGEKYKNLTEGYSGVTHKYFDDRQVEVETLNRLSRSKIYKDLVKTKVSWDECGEIKYR